MLYKNPTPELPPSDRPQRSRSRIAVAVAVLLALSFAFPAQTVPLAVAAAALVALSVALREAKACAWDSKAAESAFYVGGNGRDDVWLTPEECLRHFMVVGTSGVGKDEYMLAICRNALQTGSGAIMLNGKGDVGVYRALYAMCREYGREDDLQVVNFMADSRGHSFNPYEIGSAEALAQMTLALIGDLDEERRVRAELMTTGIMRALVWRRDAGTIDLTMRTVVEHLDLARIIDLADKEKGADLPAEVRASVDGYLASLPGFVREKGRRQAGVTLDEHGYLQMRFCKRLGSLADAYPHVLAPAKGDVNVLDTISRRRILLVMMPALYRAPDLFEDVGKIMASAIRVAMTARLHVPADKEWISGADLGAWARLGGEHQAPFFCILDDVNHYFVEGMTTMTDLARSNGVAMVFSVNEFDSIRDSHPKEARLLMAQIGNHVVMRSDDCALPSAGRPATAYLQVGEALFYGKNIHGRVSLPFAHRPSRFIHPLEDRKDPPPPPNRSVRLANHTKTEEAR